MKVQKDAKGKPGPGSYEIKSQFSTPKSRATKGLMASGGERRTVIDEISRRTKKIPAPNHYKEIKYPGK